jgi:hypothetical protein
MGEDSGKHREVLLEGEALFLLKECRCAVSERNDPDSMSSRAVVFGSIGILSLYKGMEAPGHCFTKNRATTCARSELVMRL